MNDAYQKLSFSVRDGTVNYYYSLIEHYVVQSFAKAHKSIDIRNRDGFTFLHAFADMSPLS